MQTNSLHQVIVVGAGPVGLLCALDLARQGVQVCVLELEPNTTLDLRAGTFHPPTLEMLAPLGVTQEMMKIGMKVPVWQSRDLQEGLIAEWDMSILKDDTPYPFRLHLEQHRLTPILLEMLKKYSHAQVLFSHEFLRLEQTADEVVVHVKHQDHQEETALRAQWVIGADGGKSAVRKSAGIEFEGYTWPERYSVVSTTHDFSHLGYADNAYVSDPEQWVAFFRMPDKGPPGLWRMTIPVGQSYTDEEILDPKYANGVFQRVLKTPPDVLYPIVHQSVYRVHQRVANRFRLGRVLLAGDSAHVNNPLGGFGLNSGIHDAMNLSEKLARVVVKHESDDVLDLYERQRRTVNMEYVQEISIKNKHNLEEADPKVRQERFASLRKINSQAASRREYLLVSSMINSIKKANAIT